MLGRKDLFQLILPHTHHSPSLKRVQAGTQQGRIWGQELKQKWLGLLASSPMACSTCLLIAPRTIVLRCPGVVLPSVSWALPHQSSIKKMPTDVPTNQFNGAFSQLRLPLSGLCFSSVPEFLSLSTIPAFFGLPTLWLEGQWGWPPHRHP